MTAQVLGSGKRKYIPILELLVSDAKRCDIECPHTDTRTIIDGVKKEKVKWVKRKRWPDGQALRIEITDKGVIFRMVIDTSIRNL